MRKILVISCLLSAFAAQGLAQTQMSSRQDIPKLVASARGTVVLLKTFDRQGRVLALGSGFRISGGRYVTNAHVVAGASRVEIFDDAGSLLGIARSADMLSTTVDLAILPSVGRRTPYAASLIGLRRTLYRAASLTALPARANMRGYVAHAPTLRVGVF